jgi:hypothetical protein
MSDTIFLQICSFNIIKGNGKSAPDSVYISELVFIQSSCHSDSYPSTLGAISPHRGADCPVTKKISEVFMLTKGNHRRSMVCQQLTLHTDLKIPFVKNEIQRMTERYKNQTANHDNKLIDELYANGPVTRRLNRTWPQDLINQWNRLYEGETTSLDVSLAR